ncbi:encapsidation protein 22K [Bat mastadenovirus]|uniref:Encapsidation protein 22K n=1 Tax=Bat mastadenovirus TaxID=740971 RepID=A0A3G9ENF6_9ADEN|nr:encapsidation protein 22K [Bat mastadenovirus]BBE29318.1 encapsidation protein 22K [Bat mastadenovirus]
MEDKEILSMEEISSSEEEEDLENPQESPELYSEEAAEPVERAPRWDQKTKSLGKPPRYYKSWRAHKSKIINCLGVSGGNVAFTRRYMLFREGVNLPNNIIHYYNSRYCSSAEAKEGHYQENQKKTHTDRRRR